MQLHKIVYFFLLLLITRLASLSRILHNLSILRLSSKVVLKCTIEWKFLINSGQPMGFPLNWCNLMGGKVLISYSCFKENCKLTKEVVLCKSVSWSSSRLSINASKDSISLLIGGEISPSVVLFDAFGLFVLSQFYVCLVLLVRIFNVRGYYYTIHLDVIQSYLSCLADNLFLRWKFLN